MAADGSPLPHVVFCIGGLERGGSETQIVSVVERLHGTRVDATLVTLGYGADPALVQRLRRAGVPVLTLRPRSGPRAWLMAVSTLRMGALLLRRRPAAVYAWLEEAVLLSAVLAIATRTPFLAARRNIFGRYAERSRAIVRLIYLTERRARVVTVNSRAVGDETLAHGVAADRIRLVRNGHAVDPATPEPPDDEVVLGYVARFRTEKGHRRLLDVLSRVHTETPWRADLAGDGPLRDEIEAEARRLGLDGRVRFVGPISDPAAFWRERHIAALLSDHEGSPNALIEAAMAARPMVATDVGGIPDIVAPDGGRLVAPDDADGIAAALADLIEDGDLRRRIGAAARRQAVERFSIERSVEGHWAAIEEVLAAVSGVGRPVRSA
jgi:glycosyltransferase involved in cell wall biosynthesis